jgi:hypothetical protein
MIKYVHAESGMDCIIQCVGFPHKTCRSANYNKTATSGGEKNCELLKTVHSEEDAASLKRNEHFDHYIILSPERVSTILSEYVCMLFINTMHLNWNSSHYGFIIK